MKGFWKAWVKFTKKIAGLLAGFILTIIYFFLIIPVSFILKIFNKKRLLGHNYKIKNNSYWIVKQSKKQNIDFAKQQ
jgi:hypothetical protein